MAKEHDSIARNPKRKYTIFRSLRFGRLDSERREVLDPTPMQPPIGYKKAPTLSEQIRDMVRDHHLAAELAKQGVETFDEADDFDIPDDPPDPQAPYEADFEGDASQAVKDALKEHHTKPQYGSVQEFLDANPHLAREIAPGAIAPGADPFPKAQRGVGEDLAIAPGETPTYGEPPGEPTRMGFFNRRRG